MKDFVMAKKKSIHYVNNAEFSQAVVDYCRELSESKSKELELPLVPDYIAQCFLKIAEGLSHKSNFIRYTYREEMVMDAVENCLKAINNYNVDAATRTGKPNAFAYFTQISWYAFLRRIEKEKKQQELKMRYLAQSGIDQYVHGGNEDVGYTAVLNTFLDQLKDRMDKIKEKDTKIKKFIKKEKVVRKKREVMVDSDLTKFMGN
jgi:hypothetical protein